MKSIVLFPLVGFMAWVGGAAPFAVSFEGRPLAVHEARCSALPLNQDWPGYQRPLKQTQVQYFVSFDLDRPGTLKIESADPTFAQPVRVRPLSRGKDLRLEKPEQFVIEFGDGTTNRMPTALHVFANPPFKYTHVPNEIYFGPGEHDVGVIAPTNGQTVCIAEGATVYGSIFVDRAENVRIVGRGILDSSRVNRADRNTAIYRHVKSLGHADGTAARACTNFQAFRCRNLYVEGVIFRDSPRWSFILRNECDGVLVENVKLIGMWRYNSDGIDVCASRNVTIRNSFVRSYDDCFVARGVCLEEESGPVENVTIENCVLWCDWGKNLEVWTGGKPCVVRNVTARNCQLVNVDMMACDVTCWGAPTNTLITGIAFENLEIDVCAPRWRCYNEFKKKIPFPYKPRSECELLHITARQQKTPCQVVIDGVSFTGIRFIDEMQTVPGLHFAMPENTGCIRNLRLEGLPPGTKTVRKGNAVF